MRSGAPQQGGGRDLTARMRIREERGGAGERFSTGDEEKEGKGGPGSHVLFV